MKKISLYLVATPIGNLSDISPRALEILNIVDFIAAEDTRTSGNLLKHFEIKKPLVSYYEHNLKMRGEEIIKRLKNGETCALITDAGMPAISDPGEEIVAQCHEANLIVSGVPGPCAFVTALAMSGLSTKRFCFEGFLSTAKNTRREHLEGLISEKRTMIFYEAPHKLFGTLEDMCNFFGKDRRISLVREISKIYEETLLTTLEKAIEYYNVNVPRGEFVLIVEGAPAEVVFFDECEIERLFYDNIKNGMTKAQAAKDVSMRFNIKKRDIYEKYKNNI